MNETTTLGVILAIGILLAAILSILWHLPGTSPRGDATSSTPEANRPVARGRGHDLAKGSYFQAARTNFEPLYFRHGYHCGRGGDRSPHRHRRVQPYRPRCWACESRWRGQRDFPRTGGGVRVDLAFVWWYQDDAAAMLEDLAVPVVRIRSGRAAELPAMIRLIGDCVDCRQAAERAAAQAESFLAKSPPQPVRTPSGYSLSFTGR